MKKFQYMIIKQDEGIRETETLLDQVGMEGWELVSVSHVNDNNYPILYFKREIQQ